MTTRFRNTSVPSLESHVQVQQHNIRIISLSAASLLEEAQQATSAALGSISESYRRDVCVSLDLNIFVMFMGRLEDMPHRQAL
jgi:hypothetical protein